MGRRHATRYNCRDANEPQLLAIVASMGGQWVEAAPLDGWVWVPLRRIWVPVEIKTGKRRGWKDEFRPGQKEFMAECEARGAPVFVWRNGDDTIRDMNARA